MLKFVFILRVLSFSSLLIFAQFTLCAQGLKKTDKDEVKGYFFEGLRQKHKDNYAGASTQIGKYLNHYPNDDAALYELASIQFKLGTTADAERNVTRAITLNNSNIWYYKLKADILLASNNFSQLIAIFDELQRLEPNNVQHYLDKAKALYMASRMDEVKKVYAEFRDKFGDRLELRDALKNMSIGSLEVEEDAEALKIFIEYDPTEPSNYLNLANLYMMDGMAAEALEVLELAETKIGDHFELHLGKAVIYRMLRTPELALQSVLNAFSNSEMSFDRKYHFIQQLLAEYEMVIVKKHLSTLSATIVQQHPQEPKAYVIDGDVLIKMGKVCAASERYLQALRLNDQNFIAWEKLIGVHASQVDYPALLETANNALSSFPNQPILLYYKELAKNRLKMNASQGELEYAITCTLPGLPSA